MSKAVVDGMRGSLQEKDQAHYERKMTGWDGARGGKKNGTSNYVWLGAMACPPLNGEREPAREGHLI